MSTNSDNSVEQVESVIQTNELVDEIWQRVKVLLHNEALAGTLLMVMTIFALAWANSPWGDTYHEFWHLHLNISLAGYTLDYSLQHWINDLLMAIFFFVVGLEIKREVIAGELSTLSKALLPVCAAIGGMIVPALFYVVFNYGTEYEQGWGIPMATDIAFALGILSLFGKRVPTGLKVFLAALAIADDIGAVLVIALFYSEGVELMRVTLGFGFLGVLAVFNFIGIRSPLVYSLVGFGGLWLSFLLSGIHPSVAGVLAAFTIPARQKLNAPAFLIYVRPQLEDFEKEFRDARPSQSSPFMDHHQMQVLSNLENAYKGVIPPLQRLEEQLHPWISFAVMPLFALANAGVHINMGAVQELTTPLSLGIILGLFIGKQIGIFSCTYAAVRLGLAKLPTGVSWKMIYGVSCLGGVGFTMSLFISNLAFANSHHSLEMAKLAILVGSLISGITGVVILTLSKLGGNGGSEST